MGYCFILASNSPRRRALLSRIIPRHLFKPIPSRIKERVLPGELPEKFVMRMAAKKAKTVLRNRSPKPGNWRAVIGADTVVVLGKKILQQPKSMADGRRMLRLLSGRRHEVMTGVCFLLPGSRKPECIMVKSYVWFKKLNRGMIKKYIDTGEAIDKAGAYAIQGRGRNMIRRYEGSYTNIVGLPVKEIRIFLKDRLNYPF